MDDEGDKNGAVKCGENLDCDGEASRAAMAELPDAAISLPREFGAAASTSSSENNFSAREVAAVARCLCAPLVSIRVGRVVSDGRILRPTDSRGHLELTMLPSSDLRLSFLGDEGTIETLALLSSVSPVQSCPVVLQEISTDASGRSFVLKLASNRSVFFWQSEKSKAGGDESIRKMKDILHRRPTLCQLTGIHDSRLKSIVSCLKSLLPSSPPSSGPEVSPPGSSLTLPYLSDSFICSSEGDDTPNAVCSQAALAAIGMSFGLASSTTLPGSGSIAASIFSHDGSSQRLLRSSGEVDKAAFAQRILASLPQTFVPFPLLVSGSITVPSVPLSAATSFVTPYYCPCPLGAASALQYSTFTPPHLPSLVSSSAAPPFVSAGPPPPLLPPLSFSLPSSVSGPLVGVVMPESSAGVYQGGLADILGAYSSLCFPTSVDFSRNFSPESSSSGVISSNTFSRIISFSPEKVSTSSTALISSSQTSASEFSSPGEQASPKNSTDKA